MWPFRKKQPAQTRFKIGDAVFFKVLEYGQLYAGKVRDVNPEYDRPYVIEADLFPGAFADVAESMVRAANQEPEVCRE